MNGFGSGRLVGLLCVVSLVALFGLFASAGVAEAGAVLALAPALAVPAAMEKRIADLLMGARGSITSKSKPDKTVFVPYSAAVAAIGDGDPELLADLKEQVAGRNPETVGEAPVEVHGRRWLDLLEKRHGSEKQALAAAVSGSGRGSSAEPAGKK
jgi:hypothetical protein